MIQHPLPPYILQTSLNQLPLASSQIGTQITKRKMEIKKFIQENIQTSLDLYKFNQDLLFHLKELNEVQNRSSEWAKNFVNLKKQPIIPQINQIHQSSDRLKVALRHSNIEEIIRLYQALSPNEQKQQSLIIASQIPIPNKTNRPRIVALIQALIGQNDLVESIIMTCFKILIQKFFKMNLEIKSFQTSRNQKNYYFDILQLYQRCFNKTMKILLRATDGCQTEPFISRILANVANKTRINFLSLLSNRPDEKTSTFLLGLQEYQPYGFIYKVTLNYCETVMYQRVINEAAGRVTARLLVLQIENGQKSLTDDEILTSPVFQSNQQQLRSLFGKQSIQYDQNNGDLNKQVFYLLQ